MKNKKDVKSRSWTFIVYPESAPKNWRDILDSEYIKWVESPLHDKDVNPDGTIKKPHWHILLLFDGPVRYTQALNISNEIKAPVPQKAQSAKGLVRYMVHLDNPEKYQYKKSDIIAHGGADVQDFFQLSATNRRDILIEISKFIHEEHIKSFDYLVMYSIKNNKYDWFDVISYHGPFFIKSMIDSQKNR